MTRDIRVYRFDHGGKRFFTAAFDLASAMAQGGFGEGETLTAAHQYHAQDVRITSEARANPPGASLFRFEFPNGRVMLVIASGATDALVDSILSSSTDFSSMERVSVTLRIAPEVYS
jgi:hypothetical protein